MKLYHGSPIAGLTVLKPSLSEHGKPYIYFATNPLVALLYAVKPVPKPFSFYPYGFDENGNVVYSEYFEDAFKKLYKGKIGYLYECDNLTDVERSTKISCAYTCTTNIKIDRVIKIKDLYEFYLEKERIGMFKIKPLKDVSEKEKSLALQDLKSTIVQYDLINQCENPMAIFIKEYFPDLL